jgi:hypothetical protein
MKYVGPKAELLLLSADPIMDSFESGGILDLWDIFNGNNDSFKEKNVMDIWDMLNG